MQLQPRQGQEDVPLQPQQEDYPGLNEGAINQPQQEAGYRQRQPQQRYYPQQQSPPPQRGNAAPQANYPPQQTYRQRQPQQQYNEQRR
jgi:hypothetical protein